MRSLLLTSCIATAALVTATFFAPCPAQALTVAAPTALSAAIQQTDVKENVYWRRAYWRRHAYYAPYRYAYAYRPYYAYAYRPYYSYPYRPYAYYGYPYGYSGFSYGYGSYAFGGFGVGWGGWW
jgi:hypothetical protein